VLSLLSTPSSHCLRRRVRLQNITQAVVVVVVSLRRLRRPGLTKISGIILTGTRCSARRRRRFLSSSSSSALTHKRSIFLHDFRATSFVHLTVQPVVVIVVVIVGVRRS